MVNLYTSRLDSLYPAAPDRRRAQSLAIGLLILAVGTLAYIPASIAGFAANPSTAPLGIVGFVIAVGIVSVSGVLLFQGKLASGARLQAYGYWLVALLVALLPSGIASATSSAAIFVLLAIATLSLPRPDTYIITGLYALTTVVIGLLQVNGIGTPGLALTAGIIATGGVLATVTARPAPPAPHNQTQPTGGIAAALDLAAGAAATRDLDTLLNDTAERLRAVFNLAHVDIFLIDGDSGMASLRAASGKHQGDQPVRPISLPIEANSAIASVVARQAPARINDSELALPLISQRTLHGVILIETETAAFDEETVIVLERLARFLGVAIQNSRSLSTEKALPVADGAPPAVSLPLMQTRSLDEIATVLREYVMPDADQIAIIRPDGQGNLAVDGGWSVDGAELPAACPPELEEVAAQEGLVIRDAIDFTSLPDPLRTYFGETLLISSVAVFPLPGSEGQTGYLLIGHQRSHSYSAAELDAFQPLTRQIVAQIESIDLINRMESALDESTTLYSISLALTGAQTLDEVYGTALDEIGRLTKARRIAVYQAGPDPHGQAEYVEMPAVWEDGTIHPSDTVVRTPLNEVPVLAQFPQSRANLLFPDITGEEQIDEAARDIFRGRDTRSLMIVPVATGTTWLGAIFIEGSQPDQFTDDQLRFSRNIADLTALAVDQQTLLEQSRQAAASERQLRGLADALRMAESVPDVHRIAEERLVRILNRPLAEVRAARRGERGSLTADEWRTVNNVEEQVKLAITSINLLLRTQQTVLQEQTVSEITAQLQRTAGVEDVMELTVQALRSMLPDYDVRLRLAPTEAEPGGDGDEPAGT